MQKDLPNFHETLTSKIDYENDVQTYTENIECSTNDVVDQAVKFDMTSENGVSSLAGTVLVEEEDSTVELKSEEVWKRVNKPKL